MGLISGSRGNFISTISLTSTLLVDLHAALFLTLKCQIIKFTPLPGIKPIVPFLPATPRRVFDLEPYVHHAKVAWSYNVSSNMGGIFKVKQEVLTLKYNVFISCHNSRQTG